MSSLLLVAPMQGWSAPLDEVPDAVFEGRLLGDGVAIDPTGNMLYAPCDGEVVTVAQQKHAVTLRAENGVEILLHVGIDTVALGGEGFTPHVQAGARVKAGDALLTFDLDLLARLAPSVLTPIVVADAVPVTIGRRTTNRLVAVGDFLMELIPARASAAAPGAGGAHSRLANVTTRMIVPLEHGIHARPAALLVSGIRHLSATVDVSIRGKSANARSPIALMSLGVRKGDEITIHAVGPDAAAAAKALEAAIRTAAAELDKPSAVSVVRAASPTRATDEQDAGVIRGVVASPGIAAGFAFHLVRPEITVVEAGAGTQVEAARLDHALKALRVKLEATAASSSSHAREIVVAHLEFLGDPELNRAVRDWIERDKSAAFAWRSALRAQADMLRSLPDARMAERAEDLLDLESQLLSLLEGSPSSGELHLPERAIVLASELLPSQFVALDPSRLAGICTAGGGPTSHVAILAASIDIPMLVAAGARVGEVPAGAHVILDADHGLLHITPDERELAAAAEVVSRRRARRVSERAAAHDECRTADGTRIEVLANAGSVAEAQLAVSEGAEGCGLLRTEFLFLDRDSAPDEATQTAAYQAIVAAFAGRPVVIRTLDVGGDKPLPYLPLPREENPALGVRGVRVGLQYPEVLRAQLRAILNVQPAGRCRILLPMISEAAEVRTVRALLAAAGVGASHISVGAMIETPAAAVLAGSIAREADFLSIGTNDLTQYTLAIDRGNPALAARLDALHPAVLHLIASATRAGRAAGRDVAVCGGLASDPMAVPVLIGLGVNELSAVPSVIPRLKSLIRSVSLDACRQLAQRVLEEASAVEVREICAQWARGTRPIDHQ